MEKIRNLNKSNKLTTEHWKNTNNLTRKDKVNLTCLWTHDTPDSLVYTKNNKPFARPEEFCLQ